MPDFFVVVEVFVFGTFELVVAGDAADVAGPASLLEAAAGTADAEATGFVAGVTALEGVGFGGAASEVESPGAAGVEVGVPPVELSTAIVMPPRTTAAATPASTTGRSFFEDVGVSATAETSPRCVIVVGSTAAVFAMAEGSAPGAEGRDTTTLGKDGFVCLN